MKKLTKILSLFLALTMLLCFPVAVSAAELEDAPIDESRTGSLTIYKYDLTNAEKDGVWDSSYVSTGVFDQTGVNDVLGGSGAALGNGETGYGYAIKGVEFSYLKVADIVTFSESENDSRTDSHVEVLYAIDKTKGADFLKALNLADGAQRYTFVDTLSKGLTYNKGDVVLEFFTDAACTDSVAKWTEAEGKFTISYNTTSAGESVMTIEMTADGLKEINTSKAVYSGASMVNSGYSDCTVRITYAAKMDSSNDLVFGDKGNDNKVVLTWKRSSQNYYDTLVDDCHVFSYGIDLTKLFSDGKGDFSKVEFLIQNKTDNYFVKAELNKDEGVYYVVDHVTDKADATHFVPVKTADAQGRIIVKGLEDDTYTLTEVRTDSGYVMLKQGIDVAISRKDTADSCGIYGADVLGLIQNDPRYASIIKDNGDLHNMPQKHLEHKLLTASATVDGKKVTMLEDNGSANAEAPLTVVNTRGFDLPKTGDNGTMMITLAGVLLMAGSVTVLLILNKKKLH